MSLLSKLSLPSARCAGVAAVRRPARRAGVAMEQLDHRQLLSVNFTGIVATDFPATMNQASWSSRDTFAQHPVDPRFHRFQPGQGGWVRHKRDSRFVLAAGRYPEHRDRSSPAASRPASRGRSSRRRGQYGETGP